MMCLKWFQTSWHIAMICEVQLMLQSFSAMHELCIDVYHSNYYGMKCVTNLEQLEPCNNMFKVISDIMAHCYDMWNTIIKAINFWKNELGINFYHEWSLRRKYLSDSVQSKPCNDMFKVFLINWKIVMIWEIQLLMKCISAMQRKWILLIFIISYHYGIKCVSNLLQLEPCNDMCLVISDIMADYNDMWNTIIKAIIFLKMNGALMFLISNYYGRKCLSDLLQLQPFNDLFKVISDLLANCYDVWNTIINEINFCENELCIHVYH